MSVGHIVIRGARLPFSEVSAPSKITIPESNITPPYSFKLEETMRFGLTFVTSENVNDGFDEALVFGDTFAISENVNDGFDESLEWGDVLVQGEDLQDQLAESITIENPPT